MRTLLIFFLLILLTAQTLDAQRGHAKLKSDLMAAKKYKSKENPISLFKSGTTLKRAFKSDLPAKLQGSPVMTIEGKILEKMAATKPYLLNLKIPTGGHQKFRKQGADLELELIQFDVFSSSFTQTLMPSGKIQSLEELDLGTSYRGIVKGMEHSIVMVNISRKGFSMIMSGPETGNMVMEKMKGTDEQYLLYEDQAMLDGYDFSCDYSIPSTTTPNGKRSTASRQTNQLVDGCFSVHFDIGKTIYDARGDQSTAYLQSIFTHVATLFYNEQINITIAGTTVWTNTEPFYEDVFAYVDYREDNPVNTVFSHYVHGNGGGGLAYLNGYCAGGNKYAIGMSGLENQNPQSLPNYSFPVFLLAHELGHNFGSEHTHDCAWNGNNTPIDGCGSADNGCGLSNYIPPNGGTIMSYCDGQSVGVNFSLGFGSQPGDRMRYYANRASCVGDNNCSSTCMATFTNTGCEGVEIFWNDNGDLIRYGIIPAESSRTQGTRDGHNWVFQLAGTTVATYTVSCPNPTFTVDPQVVSNNCNNSFLTDCASFTIRNKFTGEYLAENGANVILRNSEFLWSLTSANNGYNVFHIESPNSSLKVDYNEDFDIALSSNFEEDKQWGFVLSETIDSDAAAYNIYNISNDVMFLAVNETESAPNGDEVIPYIISNDASTWIVTCDTCANCGEEINESCTGSEYIYTITNVNSGLVLDVSGGSSAPGANVQQWENNGSGAQQWYFQDVGSSQYIITNVSSGLALDVDGASTTPGANIQQWGNNDSSAQQWYLQDVGNGQYAIVNVNSGLVLDIDGGSIDIGANLKQWNNNGSGAQLWLLNLISGDCNADDDCAGQGGDTDSDGICDEQDSCPDLDDSLIGSSCNDNNPNTENDTWQTNCTCTGTLVGSTRISAKVFMEGYYDGNNGLIKNNNYTSLIPSRQPFNTAPWFYNGNESTTNIPANVVDWILMVTRTVNGEVLEQRAGFITITGEVMDIDGTMGLSFDNASSYFSIHQKSHLAVMSATPYTDGIYDFTTSTNKVMGNNQLKELNGKYVLHCGDYDNNGNINAADFNLWSANSAVLNQYIFIDGDGNGVINATDYNLWVKNKSKLGHPPLQY